MDIPMAATIPIVPLACIRTTAGATTTDVCAGVVVIGIWTSAWDDQMSTKPAATVVFSGGG
jgi:hypothetical protein